MQYLSVTIQKKKNSYRGVAQWLKLNVEFLNKTWYLKQRDLGIYSSMNSAKVRSKWSN